MGLRGVYGVLRDLGFRAFIAIFALLALSTFASTFIRWAEANPLAGILRAGRPCNVGGLSN